MIKNLPQILLYLAVIVIMIGLPTFIKNDYFLTVIYLGVIIASVTIKKERADMLVLAVGFLGTSIGEYLFISTGIETFNRTSFLGVMPLWLPFLWGYIFLSIKRVFWMLVKKHL
ncbi:MAG: DUF2878 family protein [Candidatus Yanofskybacteria bacterium]|nr:DUF2878 family protein [Candidatus Yanofskybacteria bacterium]